MDDNQKPTNQREDMKYLYQWIPNHIYAPIWMARAYYSCKRNQCLFVIPPINLIIAVLWWMQDKWAKAAFAPSWIDNEAQARLDHHIRSTRDVYTPRRLYDNNQPKERE